MEEAAGISVPKAEAEIKPQGAARPRTYKDESGGNVPVNKPQPVVRPRTYKGDGKDVNVNK